MRKWITPLQVTRYMHVPHVILRLKFGILAKLLTPCATYLPQPQVAEVFSAFTCRSHFR